MILITGKIPQFSDDTLFTFGELNTVSKDTMSIIKSRTKSGIDVNGSKFRNKSDGSQSFLYDTGNMLNGLQSTISPTQQEIDIQSTVKYGENHNAGVTLPKREWFGLQISEAFKILDKLIAIISAKLEK